MNYRVILHPSVKDDLDWIGMMLIDYVGRKNAAEKVVALRARFKKLSSLPHVGTLRDEVAGLRAIPFDDAVISFLVDDQARKVEVISVTWGGMDWISRVRKRT